MPEATERLWQEKQKRKNGEFLQGPVPLPWLISASELPACALKLGLALWFRAGCERRQSNLKVSPKLLRRFGIPPSSTSRGLDCLVDAGLISAERGTGRAPRVTILEVPSQ